MPLHDTQSSRNSACRKKSVLSLHAVFLCASVLLALWVYLHIGKVSAAVVTLLPALVAHIRPVCYRCHGLHFPLTPSKKPKYNLMCDAFFMSGNCLYFICIIYCVLVWPIYQILFLGRKNKKRQWGRILMNVEGGCGRSPWSVTNLCLVVLLWPLRDVWMNVWLPGPALFSRSVLYVFFLILGCTSGKRLPSTPQYVPQ